LQADLIESCLWAAVERVLQQPDTIAAEVARPIRCGTASGNQQHS
jgi:hypothetical protein